MKNVEGASNQINGQFHQYLLDLYIGEGKETRGNVLQLIRYIIDNLPQVVVPINQTYGAKNTKKTYGDAPKNYILNSTYFRDLSQAYTPNFYATFFSNK